MNNYQCSGHTPSIPPPLYLHLGVRTFDRYVEGSPELRLVEAREAFARAGRLEVTRGSPLLLKV